MMDTNTERVIVIVCVIVASVSIAFFWLEICHPKCFKRMNGPKIIDFVWAKTEPKSNVKMNVQNMENQRRAPLETMAEARRERQIRNTYLTDKYSLNISDVILPNNAHHSASHEVMASSKIAYQKF